MTSSTLQVRATGHPTEEAKRSIHRRLDPALTVSLAALAAYVALTSLLWWQRIASWDHAFFNQVAQGYASLDAPIVDVRQPGMHQFGEHFSPVLALLGPVYRAFPTGLSLQIVQSVLIAASVYVVTRAARRELGDSAAWLLGFSYAFSFGVAAALTGGLHEYAFAAPLLALVGDRYLRADYRSAALWSLPLLLVKEDMGLVLMALGLVLAWRGARRLGASLVAGGAAFVVVVLAVVIPTYNPGDEYGFLAISEAEGRGGLLATLMYLPVDLFWPPVKIATLLLTLGVVAFAAVRSPFLLLAAPLVVERFVSPWPLHWNPYWHYSLPLMAIVFVAAIEVLRGLRAGESRVARRYATVAPLAAAVICVGVAPGFDFVKLMDTSMWSRSDRAVAADEILARIEPGSSVQSDSSLIAFFDDSNDVYYLSPPEGPLAGYGQVPADYIVFESSRWSDVDPMEFVRETYPRRDYQLVLADEGLHLLERVDR
jgi:uncharacterized membrane protein